MKLMIASDIHGSSACCKQLMQAFEREDPDRLLLLGDLLYHGPRNGLPDEYDPKQVFGMLNSIKNRILAVRGNCDTEIDQMVLEFPMMAEYCILYLDPSEAERETGSKGRMIFATHGHHFNKDALPMLSPGDILLHGHTHLPAWEEVPLSNLGGKTVWYLNPGSVSFPKGGTPHGYMTLSTLEESGTETKTVILWKDLSGNTYHELVL